VADLEKKVRRAKAKCHSGAMGALKRSGNKALEKPATRQSVRNNLVIIAVTATGGGSR
jgi:hypothetical protein